MSTNPSDLSPFSIKSPRAGAENHPFYCHGDLPTEGTHVLAKTAGGDPGRERRADPRFKICYKCLNAPGQISRGSSESTTAEGGHRERIQAQPEGVGGGAS